MSISSRWDFLMISRSRKLIWLLVSSVGESCMLLCMELAWCRLPLNRTRQLREWKTILHITTSNNFPTTLLQKLKQQIQHKLTTPPPTKNTENNTKWTTFTFSPHIRKITNLFRHTNVKISYRCSNAVAQLIKPASGHNIPPHIKSGVYCLTCKTCNLSYVGQTSQT